MDVTPTGSGRVVERGSVADRAEQLALYAVPAMIALTAAIVLLGPGQEREVVGVRVRGAPVRGAPQVTLAVQSVKHYGGLFAAAPSTGVSCRLGDSPVSAGSTDSRGWLTALITTPSDIRDDSRWPLTVEWSDDKRSSFIDSVAPWTVTAAAWPAGSVTSWPALGEIDVIVPRGQIAPPFAEELWVRATVARGEAVFTVPTIAVETPGTELKATKSVETRCDARACHLLWSYRVEVRAPTAPISVLIGENPTQQIFNANLPIASGFAWVDPQLLVDRQIRLRSPSPWSTAHVSLLSEHGVVWAMTVPLKQDSDGFATATLPLPGIQALAVGVASDANQDPSQMAVWPLGERTVVAGTISTLIDTLPAAIENDRRRRQRARVPAYTLTLVGGFLYLVFIGYRGRQRRQQLTEHLKKHGIDDGAAPIAVGLGWRQAAGFVALMLLLSAIAMAIALG